MDGLFRYIGHRETCYFKYLDLGRGGTLIAVPGQIHHIYATEANVPLPPPDGRWVPVEPEPEPEPEEEKPGRSIKAKSEPPPPVAEEEEETAEPQESE